MNALVYKNKQLNLMELPKPKPKEDEVLIKVLMAGICNTDLEITQGYLGFSGIIGHEFVGEVVHDPLREFKGKRVVGSINISCNKCEYCQRGMYKHCKNLNQLGIRGSDGVFAEFTTLPRKNIHVVPECIANQEAVFVEPMAAGVEIAEQIHIKPSEEVVVQGDGKLGLVTSMVLWTMGVNVRLIGKHQEKMDIVEELGIPTCFPKEVESKYEIIIECTGSSDGLNIAQSLVKPTGTIVAKTTIKDMDSFDLSKLVVNEISIIGSRCGPFEPTLRFIENNKFPFEKMIDGIYSLEEWEKAFKSAKHKETLKVLFQIS